MVDGGEQARQGRADAARAFLETLYQFVVDGDAFDEDLELEIRSIRAGRPLRKYHAVETITEAVAVLLGDGDAEGDAYMGVHPRRRGVGKGGESSVEALVAVFADIDCDKAGVTREKALDLVAHAPWGAPTLVVDSGGGLHVYWAYKERLDADEDTFKEHRKAAAWVRAWVNDGLGAQVADDMSTRDRILRCPGSFNWKPKRRLRSGRPPAVRLLRHDPSLTYDVTDVLDWIPAGFNPDAHAGRPAAVGTEFDPDDLPTDLPQQLKRVLAAAGIPFHAKRDDHGRIAFIQLKQCPVCGSTDRSCYLTPRAGALRTFRDHSCKAAKRYTGGPGKNGSGLALAEWVPKYASKALGAMKRREAAPESTAKADSLELAFAELAAAQPADVGDRFADVLSSASALARAGTDAAGLLWVWPGVKMPDRAPRQLRGVVKSAGEGRALVPLRDGEGRVRSGLWLDTGDRLGTRVAFSAGDEEVAGGVFVLGSLPTAAAAAGNGETLFVTHGAVDYFALRGLLASGKVHGEALGVVKNPARVADRLVTWWNRHEKHPDRVVFIGGDADTARAVEKLRGVAGAARGELAEFESVDDALQALGTSPVAELLEDAPLTIPPPVSIDNAQTHLVAKLRQAVVMAVNTSTVGKPALVIFTPPAGVGKSTEAQRLAAEIASGAYPGVPVQGRKPRGWPEGKPWPPPERAVGFATPSHALADEKHEIHEALGLLDVAPRDRFHGALHHCEYAEKVAGVYEYVGRRGICGDKGSDQRCPLADECDGADVPKAIRGRVSYISDAMARLMRLDFAFLDESTGVIDETGGDRGRVSTLFAGSVHARSRRWRREENPEAPHTARVLLEIIDPIAREHAAYVGKGQVDPYPRRIYGEDLWQILDSEPNLAESMRLAFGGELPPPPIPSPGELRSGLHAAKHMPNRRAFQVLAKLYKAYRAARAEQQSPLPDMGPTAPDAMPVLQLNEDATWHFEILTVRPLPKCPVVMLDATGELTADEYRAAYPDRTVKVFDLLVYGTPPALAVHVQTRGLSRRALFHPVGGLTPRGARRIWNLVVKSANLTRRHAKARDTPDGPAPLTLGVLTYKAVHDVFAGDRADPFLASAHRELASRGIRLELGYFGRDDRGTNRFENVDGLLVLGDARPNLGVVETHAVLLGLDPVSVMGRRAEAVLVQATFRARHTRRGSGDEVVLVAAGAEAPPIAGVTWREGRILGRPTTDTRELAYELTAACAESLGVVGYAVVTHNDWSGSGFGAGRAAERLHYDAIDLATRAWVSARPAWRPFQVHIGARGRPPTVYSETPDAVLEWATGTFGDAWVVSGRQVVRAQGGAGAGAAGGSDDGGAP